ncbi:MAG: ribbon-helix-helix domain-containing protein [Candidatus Gottesmanbacteria bacterium]|nr:ribbon-helix-helix domain-containing protein [Candidatus Gottesmanbacteria bacterium]
MDTINISLPSQLKAQAETLIDQGHYASFSDIVRNALRLIIRTNYYDDMAREAVEDYRQGKTKALRTKKDIDAFVRQAMA